MLTMQYDITLPADYDMAIIRRRIADKGHLMDDFPGLAFKAYLHASRDDAALPSRDNHYAPFYLWRGIEGMNTFLGGAGFAGLAHDFGRPPVHTWSTWHVDMDDDLHEAVSATRDIVDIAPDMPMAELREADVESASGARTQGALAAVSGFDPGGWTLVRFHLWPDLHAAPARNGRQRYRVGHVSQSHPR